MKLRTSVCKQTIDTSNIFRKGNRVYRRFFATYKIIKREIFSVASVFAKIGLAYGDFVSLYPLPHSHLKVLFSYYTHVSHKCVKLETVRINTRFYRKAASSDLGPSYIRDMDGEDPLEFKARYILRGY